MTRAPEEAVERPEAAAAVAAAVADMVAFFEGAWPAGILGNSMQINRPPTPGALGRALRQIAQVLSPAIVSISLGLWHHRIMAGAAFAVWYYLLISAWVDGNDFCEIAMTGSLPVYVLTITSFGGDISVGGRASGYLAFSLARIASI